jgi:hypothetical protein
MTDQKKDGPKRTGPAKDRFQAEFEALPLEEKFASLLKMEAVTISEAFSYAVNSPMKVVEKVGDVISELGIRLEAEIRNASHFKERNKPRAAKSSTAKPKSRTARKPASPRAPRA